MESITRAYIENITGCLKRKPAACKNDFGRVLVMAGSPGMAGAAVLCGRSALKSGSGLVAYSAPESIRNILQTAVPEATCLPRAEKTLAKRYDAIAAGPGLGDCDADKPLIVKILTEYDGVLVLDADGLNDILRFGLTDDLAAARPQVIITPHEGEAARLLRVSNIISREKAVFDLTEKYNVITVLKGHETLIAARDGRSWRNVETGNPGMATGGSGDVLTGVIASLAGQGMSAEQAAAAGVYIHGHAGDICAEETGEIGMTAADICSCLPRAFREIVYSK